MIRPLLACLLLPVLLVVAGRAAESESLPEQTLRQIVAQERAIFAQAEKQGAHYDQESLHTQLESVVHEYELLLRENPKFAEAYAAYGELLWRTDMRKASMAMMLKANAIDPNMPFVKNKIGNYLAEDDKPLDAVNYFISAIKLAPNEPLYHYNFGLLLYTARDEFIKSGDWTREEIDRTAHDAFKRAAELAPHNIAYTYRYAESFYDMEHPDWNAALKVWSQLEQNAKSPLERETMRLQAANVLIKQGRPDYARAILATVTQPDLQVQKEKLIALMAENAKK